MSASIARRAAALGVAAEPVAGAGEQAQAPADRAAFVPGTRARLTIKGEFRPLNPTPESERLFAVYQRAAAEAGLKVEAEFTGGCADSGFTAALGVPTLCGVGPVGGLAHSPEEYLEVESIVPRVQAMARAILRLEQAGI